MSGLQLLNPLGLLALLALGLPLLIHLFSRSRGRRILIGNIALYRQGQRRQVMEPKIVQWLLLLLRMLLLAVAALLLAELARPQRPSLSGSTAYVTPEWLAVSGRRDALTEHAQVFLLAPDFPTLDSLDDASARLPSDPWSLLLERLATRHHTDDVHIYALAAARQWPALAPALPGNLQWHLDDRAPVPASVPRLSVLVAYDGDRRADAELIAAALALIAEHRQVVLSVDLAPVGDVKSPRPGEPEDGEETRRALIWLAAQPAPADLAVDRVLEDRPPGVGAPVEVVLPATPRLRFLARPAAAPGGSVRWRAGNGAPLLVQTTYGVGARLVYLDRLSGKTDGLLARAAFPDLLLRLLLGEESWSSGADRAAADPRAAVARSGAAPAPPLSSLVSRLALLLVLLFAAERWLSERPGTGVRS